MPHYIDRTIEPFINTLLSPINVLCLLFKVYPTSIYMNLGEGVWGRAEGPPSPR
jgi:hypothetical protein